MVSESEVYKHLYDVIDPELYVSIVDLGLIYRVDVRDNRIEVDFTLTSLGCPMEEEIRQDIVETLQRTTGVSTVEAKVVWSPRWGPDRMSEEARLVLGYPI